MRELAGRRLRSRLRHRVLCRHQPADDAPVALLGRAGELDVAPGRLHRPVGPLLHRLVDHAAEEEPRRARAGPRQDRSRLWPPDGAAHADEGAAAGLQQGQPGRQGAALRHRGHPGGHAAPLCRHDHRHPGARRAHASGGSRGLFHRHRPCRLPGQARPALPRCPRTGGTGRARGVRRWRGPGRSGPRAPEGPEPAGGR